MQQEPRAVSLEVSTNQIVFRILPPQAKTVALRASDVQGLPRGARRAFTGALSIQAGTST
jgi:hypothetical protein